MVNEPDSTAMAHVVYLILNKETERALQLLSSFYHIKPPTIAVGTVRGKRRTVYAVYVRKEAKIYATDSEIFFNPFVVLHEFYHHLRSRGGDHRGTEKHADLYAKRFIESYKELAQRAASDARSQSGENVGNKKN